MRKIPTIFERDRTRKGHPILADVYRVDPTLLARATPTVKWDGVAVELDDAGRWWVRHVCTCLTWPPGFRFVEHDATTRKDVGWRPLDLLADADGPLVEAIRWDTGVHGPGTYEAVNRPGALGVVPHGHPAILYVPIDFEGLRDWCEANPDIEGIVWWLDGAPVGKIKRFDLGLPWPQVSPVGETDPRVVSAPRDGVAGRASEPAGSPTGADR